VAWWLESKRFRRCRAPDRGCSPWVISVGFTVVHGFGAEDGMVVRGGFDLWRACLLRSAVGFYCLLEREGAERGGAAAVPGVPCVFTVLGGRSTEGGSRARDVLDTPGRDLSSRSCRSTPFGRGGSAQVRDAEAWCGRARHSLLQSSPGAGLGPLRVLLRNAAREQGKG